MHDHVAMVSDVALLRDPRRVTGLEQLAVLAAGLGAGVLTSTVGVASLLSFPVLVALGLPPVVANASNTVGLTPGRAERLVRLPPRAARAPARSPSTVLVTCAVGGGRRGACCCSRCRPGVFEAVVPWLVLFTCRARRRAAVGLARGSAPAAARTPPDRVTMSPVTTGASPTLTGVYGGYFGAGSGVMMMAVLGFGLDIELRVVNALKTLAVLAGQRRGDR